MPCYCVIRFAVSSWLSSWSAVADWSCRSVRRATTKCWCRSINMTMGPLRNENWWASSTCLWRAKRNSGRSKQLIQPAKPLCPYPPRVDFLSNFSLNVTSLIFLITRFNAKLNLSTISSHHLLDNVFYAWLWCLQDEARSRWSLIKLAIHNTTAIHTHQCRLSLHA